MTVSLPHRMQKATNSKGKQIASKRPMPARSALGSPTSLSCVPVSFKLPLCSDDFTDPAATIQNGSSDEYTELPTDAKQDDGGTDAVDQTSRTSEKGSQSDSYMSIPRTPPPSLASRPSSPTEAIIMVESAKTCDKCVKISENVPVPSKTDVIARVSRDDLLKEGGKHEEGSDEYASGEEWDESQYSTADEDDCEMELKRKKITSRQIVSDDSSEDESSNNLESARTDQLIKRAPCGAILARLTANSDGLRPTVVRQVSEEEDVRVTSDDEERLSQQHLLNVQDDDQEDEQEDRDDPIIQMEYISECIPRMTRMNHDIATSPIPGKMINHSLSELDKRDDATEPIHWQEERPAISMSKNASVESEDRVEPGMQCHLWSIPTTPYVDRKIQDFQVMCVPRRELVESVPVPRISARGKSCAQVPSMESAASQQTAERRVNHAVVQVLSVCEEELGPLAVTLTQLQEKVRRLNLPEINDVRRTFSNPICVPPTLATQSSNAMSRSTIPSLRPTTASTMQRSGSRSERVARIGSEVDSLCRHCGLQVGAEANLSPVARMYVMLAKPHRTSLVEDHKSEHTNDIS